MYKSHKNVINMSACQTVSDDKLTAEFLLCFLLKDYLFIIPGYELGIIRLNKSLF